MALVTDELDRYRESEGNHGCCGRYYYPKLITRYGHHLIALDIDDRLDSNRRRDEGNIEMPRVWGSVV